MLHHNRLQYILSCFLTVPIWGIILLALVAALAAALLLGLLFLLFVVLKCGTTGMYNLNNYPSYFDYLDGNISGRPQVHHDPEGGSRPGENFNRRPSSTREQHEMRPRTSQSGQSHQ
ncbi:hypothetical protein FKM82_028479 [Ascaphus truei]